jgi:hypothetical protein
MTEPTLTAGRRVLLWRPDSDTSHVEESVLHAARFLQAAPDAVVAAIDQGELLDGWFVDWAVNAA